VTLVDPYPAAPPINGHHHEDPFAQATATLQRDHALRQTIAGAAKAIADFGGQREQITFIQALATATGITPPPTDAEATALLDDLDKDTGLFGDPLQRLQRRLKLPNLIEIRKHGGRGGTYDLVLDDGTVIDLNGTTDVLDSRKVQAAIADTTAIVIAETTRPKWAPVAQCIFTLARETDDGDTRLDALHGWLADYSRGALRIDLDRREDVIRVITGPQAGRAFHDMHGRLWIHSDRFAKYLRLDLTIRMTTQELGRDLRLAGYTRHQLSLREGATVHKRWFWHSTDSHLSPASPTSPPSHTGETTSGRPGGQRGQGDTQETEGLGNDQMQGTPRGHAGTSAIEGATS
jgi:hypothetical protein